MNMNMNTQYTYIYMNVNIYIDLNMSTVNEHATYCDVSTARFTCMRIGMECGVLWPVLYKDCVWIVQWIFHFVWSKAFLVEFSERLKLQAKTYQIWLHTNNH